MSAEIIDLQRIIGDGYHNAFTDLAIWRDHTYLCYRTAQSHGIDPPGDVVICRSSDLSSWEQVARFGTGADDRDPKFIIDTDQRLAVVFGSWFPRWSSPHSIASAEHDLISHLSVTRDGTSWSTPRQLYGVNYWMWRIFRDEGGVFWCPAYHFGRRDDRDMRTVHLLRSEDLFDWRLIGAMRSGGGPGEPVLFAPEPGKLACVVCTLEPQHHSWLGHRDPASGEWTWDDLGVMIHAPVVLQHQGRLLVAGRSQEEDLPADGFVSYREQGDPSGHHTSVWEINGTSASHVLTVPSGHDCSYCGLASAVDGTILMSYYSQHERLPLPRDRPTPADVYLARFQL